MDQNVDPCHDFYQFSCGGWIKNVQLDEKPTESTTLMFSSKVEKDINNLLAEDVSKNEINSLNLPRKLYRVCMDEGENLGILKVEFFFCV